MNIVVPVKLVPDLVEELEIDESGTALDTEWMRLILNEFDDHAIEQAILLKEGEGAEVTVIAPAVEGAEDALYAAAARGADRLVMLTGPSEIEDSNHALARALADIIDRFKPALILTGVQTHNDLDGPVGSLLAAYLEMPYVGYVAGVTVNDPQVKIRKEYPGGLVAEMGVSLPAVLGIQAAAQPPRYVAFSKVRQAMKTATIETVEIASAEPGGGAAIERLFQPDTGARAAMLEGSEEEIAARLVGILQEAGLL